MAKFNGNVYGYEFAQNKNEQMKCSVLLQECLSKEDYELLKQDYDATDKSIEWWRFAFDKVTVSYQH